MSFPFFRWLRQRLDLSGDMATPAEIMADVEKGIAFRGANLWVLVFAILVASVGLNVNSTAVIIGAMLLSPLMGPIVGIGFGAATAELPLVHRGLKSLLVAAGISLAVSALYFRLTPLTDAGSELLARTTPTTWDVLIALFGGAAGAVGLTRREHSNVIPGVAIATALMPPLCTAGYGLATGHWAYLFGALYLFFINGVFISLATFLVVRLLPLPHHAFVSRQRARRVEWSIWAVAVLTAGPSVYLAAGIVHNTIFTHNAQQFVDEQFNQPGSYVVTRRLAAGERSINVLLAGQRYSPAQLQAARARLPRYHLAGATLTVRQGLAHLDSADAQSLRANLLDDLRSRNEQTLASYDTRLAQLQATLAQADSAATRPAAPALPSAAALLREVQAEHPAVRRLGLSQLVQPAAGTGPADTVVVVALQLRQPLPATEQQRLTAWLRLRTGGRQPLQLLLTPDTPARSKAR